MLVEILFCLVFVVYIVYMYAVLIVCRDLGRGSLSKGVIQILRIIRRDIENSMIDDNSNSSDNYANNSSKNSSDKSESRILVK